MKNEDLKTMTIQQLQAEQYRLFKIIPHSNPFIKMTNEDQDLIERMFEVTDLLEAE